MSEAKQDTTQLDDDEVRKIHEAAGMKQVSWSTLKAALESPCPKTALYCTCSACGDDDIMVNTEVKQEVPQLVDLDGDLGCACSGCDGCSVDEDTTKSHKGKDRSCSWSWWLCMFSAR